MNNEKHKNREKILYKEELYKIQGTIFEVYQTMGCRFLKTVYQECLERESILQRIPFQAQKELNPIYKGEVLPQKYIPDFMCYENIILEIKSAKEISLEHKAQVINYLKFTGAELGLLVNFGSYPKVMIERLINLKNNNEIHERYEK